MTYILNMNNAANTTETATFAIEFGHLFDNLAGIGRRMVALTSARATASDSELDLIDDALEVLSDRREELINLAA